MTMKHKMIYDPVFRSETMFYCCKDGQDAIDHAGKKYKVKIPNTSFDGFKGTCVEVQCDKTGITFWLVWVNHKHDWKTIVHESAHLVFRILDKRLVKYDSDNDETWCYLHEYFVSDMWHIMCKK